MLIASSALIANCSARLSYRACTTLGGTSPTRKVRASKKSQSRHAGLRKAPVSSANVAYFLDGWITSHLLVPRKSKRPRSQCVEKWADLWCVYEQRGHPELVQIRCSQRVSGDPPNTDIESIDVEPIDTSMMDLPFMLAVPRNTEPGRDSVCSARNFVIGVDSGGKRKPASGDAVLVASVRAIAGSAEASPRSAMKFQSHVPRTGQQKLCKAE
jgi:hypothetical protein